MEFTAQFALPGCQLFRSEGSTLEVGLGEAPGCRHAAGPARIWGVANERDSILSTLCVVRERIGYFATDAFGERPRVFRS
jgi:hypothetical protein